MLSKCGVQFQYRYLDGIKIPPAVALVVGTAVHKGVAADLTEKIAKGTLLPEEQVKDIARDALVAEWQKGVTLDEDYSAMGEKKAEAAATDTAVALARLHHTQVAPGINPTHVERPWVLDITGLPIQLAGTIDVQEGLKVLRDTKTASKSPAAETADKSLQLTTYALAVKMHDGAIPEKFALDYLVNTKTPKLVQLESKRTDQDFKHLQARIYQAHRMIETGVFQPAAVDSWICTPRFCGYWGMCEFAARPVSVAA